MIQLDKYTSYNTLTDINNYIPSIFQRNRIINLLAPIFIILDYFYQDVKKFFFFNQEYLSYNCGVSSFEKFLNKKLDSANERIKIINVPSDDKIYLFNFIEQQPPVYVYNNWSISTNYIVGDFVFFKNNIYKCINNNISSYPNSLIDWVKDQVVIYVPSLYDLENSISPDYIVSIPTDIISEQTTGNESDGFPRLVDLINRYNFAGKKYLIQKQ